MDGCPPFRHLHPTPIMGAGRRGEVKGPGWGEVGGWVGGLLPLTPTCMVAMVMILVMMKINTRRGGGGSTMPKSWGQTCQAIRSHGAKHAAVV